MARVKVNSESVARGAKWIIEKRRSGPRTVTQGVWSTEIPAWNVFKGKIKLGQVEQPPGLSVIQIARLVEVSQILVVSKDSDCGGGTEKVVAPCI